MLHFSFLPYSCLHVGIALYAHSFMKGAVSTSTGKDYSGFEYHLDFNGIARSVLASIECDSSLDD